MNGIVLLNILAAYMHSPWKAHRVLFDLAYGLFVNRKLAGVAYRGQIAAMAEKFHTQNWEYRYSELYPSLGTRNEKAIDRLAKLGELTRAPSKAN